MLRTVILLFLIFNIYGTCFADNLQVEGSGNTTPVSDNATGIEPFALEKSGNCTLYNPYTYVMYSGKSVHISWGASTASGNVTVDHYELRVFNLERNDYVFYTSVNGTEYRYKTTKSGHFVFEVRAVGSNGVTSAWASSMDDRYAKVHDKAQAWWVYTYTAPPGGIILP